MKKSCVHALPISVDSKHLCISFVLLHVGLCIANSSLTSIAEFTTKKVAWTSFSLAFTLLHCQISQNGRDFLKRRESGEAPHPPRDINTTWLCCNVYGWLVTTTSLLQNHHFFFFLTGLDWTSIPAQCRGQRLQILPLTHRFPGSNLGSFRYSWCWCWWWNRREFKNPFSSISSFNPSPYKSSHPLYLYPHLHINEIALLAWHDIIVSQSHFSLSLSDT